MLGNVCVDVFHNFQWINLYVQDTRVVLTFDINKRH